MSVLLRSYRQIEDDLLVFQLQNVRLFSNYTLSIKIVLFAKAIEIIPFY